MRDLPGKDTREAISPAVSVLALKRFRQPMIEYLRSGLEDEDKWVRIMAVLMLGEVGDACTAEYIRPLLADHDRDLRVAAERSLAMICSPHMAYAKPEADHCGDCMIRLVASEALERLKDGR